MLPTRAIALHNGLQDSPAPVHSGIEVPERNPIFFGKGVLAVQTVKTALVAAIAIVALVVCLLPAWRRRAAVLR